MGENDQSLTVVREDHAAKQAKMPPRVMYELAVLHVLVPRDEADAMRKVWNFVREDVLDVQTAVRLHDNGIRVGVGHEQWWPAIKAAMDSIEGHRVTFAKPLSVPVAHLLALELDTEARKQTLFHLGEDGILRGATWPASRNVLRLSHMPAPEGADKVVLEAVPEVHQRQEGWRWVRQGEELWQVPRQAEESFQDAAFRLELDPGEFALIAPGENAGIFGLLGGAFLTRSVDGERYNSYIFLRPEARQIGQDD